MGGFSSGFRFGRVGWTSIIIPKSSPTHLKISKYTSESLKLMQSEERDVWMRHAGRCLSEDVQSTCKRLRSEEMIILLTLTEFSWVYGRNIIPVGLPPNRCIRAMSGFKLENQPFPKYIGNPRRRSSIGFCFLQTSFYDPISKRYKLSKVFEHVGRIGK